MSWNPFWDLEPAPKGEDEPQVIELYLKEVGDVAKPWEELPEWVRESWRRELRD